jgi:hypothetical protein
MATIVGLLIALSAGYFLYQSYLERTNFAQASPQQQIDVVGIKSALLSIGQAERQYLVAHGTYGTLDQLQQDGSATIGMQQRGYAFDIVAEGSRTFLATATPTDSTKAGWPTLVMNETMQIRER